MPNRVMQLLKLLSSLMVISVICVRALPAQAIGVSPVDIIVDDVLPNSSVTKELYISRGDASAESVVIVTFEGEAAQYIKTPLGTSVVLPAGENTFAYPLVIEPGTLASGTYQTKINVAVTKPPVAIESNSTAGVLTGTTILSGAQSTITFTVTNKAVEQYGIDGVEMASSEENQLIGFSYLMLNTGNVDTRPARVAFSAIDEIDSSNTYIETIPADRLEIVPAFTTTLVTVSTQAQLTVGMYNVTLTFYNADDETIYVSDTLRLQIFPSGTLAQKVELTDFTTDKTTYRPAEPVILSAQFNNIGAVGVSASLIVEIMKDGIRLDILKNEPVFVPIAQLATLEQSFKPTEGGSYTAISYVNYGIFTTEKKETTFTVETLSNKSIGIFISIVLLVAGGFTFLIYHRRRKPKNDADNVYQ